MPYRTDATTRYRLASANRPAEVGPHKRIDIEAVEPARFHDVLVGSGQTIEIRRGFRVLVMPIEPGADIAFTKRELEE